MCVLCGWLKFSCGGFFFIFFCAVGFKVLSVFNNVVPKNGLSKVSGLRFVGVGRRVSANVLQLPEGRANYH